MGKIHTAVERRQLTRLRAILAAEPALVHQPYHREMPVQPIHVAAWHDSADIVALLLDHGADIHARGPLGWSPLHYTAREGAVKAAQLLLARGADVDPRDANGLTPLFYASRGREPECDDVAAILLAHGAAVDLNIAVCLGDFGRVRDMLARDPLAVQHAPFPRDLIYDVVVAIGLHISQHSSDRIPYVATLPSEEVLEIVQRDLPTLEDLLGAGADINAVGHNGVTALHSAVQMEHPFVAEFLLERGADPRPVQAFVSRRFRGFLAMAEVLRRYGLKIENDRCPQQPQQP